MCLGAVEEGIISILLGVAGINLHVPPIYSIHNMMCSWGVQRYNKDCLHPFYFLCLSHIKQPQMRWMKMQGLSLRTCWETALFDVLSRWLSSLTGNMWYGRVEPWGSHRKTFAQAQHPEHQRHMQNEYELQQIRIETGSEKERLLLQMDLKLHFQKVKIRVRGHPTMPSTAEVEIFVFLLFISVKEMLYLIPLVIENSNWKELAAKRTSRSFLCLPQIFQELGLGIMKQTQKK